jgi:5-methyltetrahydrofolate--homocysteine methyltransferase
VEVVLFKDEGEGLQTMSEEQSLAQIGEAIITGNSDGAVEAIEVALSRGIEAHHLLNSVMTPAMNEVGRRMKEREFFIPEVLVAARAMQKGVETLQPYLGEGDASELGAAVIGTVRGDLHDIGKNLVALMLEGVGFKVIDLGVDVSPGKFVAAVVEHRPKILGMSAILTTTMLEMGEVIDVLKREGLRDDLKILVGGAPVSEQFARDIGADGTAPECGSAAELARRMVGAH